jgi:hypothetical protein
MALRPSRQAWSALALALASLAVLVAADVFMQCGGLGWLGPAPADPRIDYLLKLQAARSFPGRVSVLAFAVAGIAVSVAVRALAQQRRWPSRPNTGLAIISLVLAVLSLPGAWLLEVHCYFLTMSWPGGE